MAVTTYIVSIEDFSKRANISQNLLTNRFKQESGIDQEIYAIKIMCQAFYDAFLTELANDNLSTANTALLPYLKDYLVFKIYASYLVDGNLLATPAGLRTQIDATSETASDKQMAEAVAKAKSRGNFFQDKLVNFLQCNEDDYPLWRDSNCGCSADIRVKRTNSFSKIGVSKGRTKINWT